MNWPQLPTARCILLATAITASVFIAAEAADASNFDAADASYGKGVRAYHSGQLLRAESYFNESLGYNSNDPRLFYYRAALLRRQGRYYEAEAEARTAATLEANGRGGAFNVDRALERLQGSERLFLERVRRETRKAMASGSFPTPSQRAPHDTPGRRTALKAPFRLSLDMLASVESPQDLARLVAKARKAGYKPESLRVVVEDDPFLDDPIFATADGEAEVATPKGMSDPFGASDEGTADTGGVSDDPFGTGTSPASDPAEDASDDPFGDSSEDSADLADPFADDAASDTTPAPEDDPFANPF